MSKIFTTIINNRLSSYCDKYHTISDAQFGFRKGRSTTDAIFALLSLVHYLNNNNRLFVVFVDLKKCFDSIYRHALWYNLHKFDIRGKLLRVMCNMYSHVKSCVKHCNSFSDFFAYAVGVRQGEVISPILVSLFLEDLEMFLHGDNNSGVLIDDIVLIILLFADDMAIFGNRPEDLQTKLNLLHGYLFHRG